MVTTDQISHVRTKLIEARPLSDDDLNIIPEALTCLLTTKNTPNEELGYSTEQGF